MPVERWWNEVIPGDDAERAERLPAVRIDYAARDGALTLTQDDTVIELSAVQLRALRTVFDRWFAPLTARLTCENETPE